MTNNNNLHNDLQGAAKLSIDAVNGITNLVEALHRNISGLAPIVGASREGNTSGITGLVYRSVHAVTNVVGDSLDVALAKLAPFMSPNSADNLTAPSPQREAVLAALNGVSGDYLASTGNSLAIPMSLRVNGVRLSTLPAKRKLIIMVHGLCMNDLQWTKNGHNHGEALAKQFDYGVAYLHYNTGDHISNNGTAFANLLEMAVKQASSAGSDDIAATEIEEIVLLCHSMGGLVSRSACAYAKQAKHEWLSKVKKIIFLGTPHHGATLERAGNWADIFLGISPYAAPFTKLTKIRSAGITDLRYGNLQTSDWQNKNPETTRDLRTFVPLPAKVDCYFVAATKQPQPPKKNERLFGDGLVAVKSALGQHQQAALSLKVPEQNQLLVYGVDHFELLCDARVYAGLVGWLDG